MSEMRTEEEQVEALKDWWKENGRSLLLGVALALAIVFGWKGWETISGLMRKMQQLSIKAWCRQ